MPALGISPAGFSIPNLAQILLNYQTAVLANINAALDLSDDQPQGQLIGIMANFDTALWELAQAVYDAYDPNNAEGAALDNIGAIRGIPREGPTYTQVTIPAGSLVISASDAPYASGSLVANVAGQPSQQFSNLNQITGAMITGGLNNLALVWQSTTIGPTPTVNPNTLTQITEPVTGWTSITNGSNSSNPNGVPEEPDDEYLIRQNEEIGVQGSCTPPAIVAQLYELLAYWYGQSGTTGNYSVSFYENTSLTTLVVGGTLTLPGKTFAVVIYDPGGKLPASQPVGGWSALAGPETQEGSTAATVWQNKPAGIASVGAISGLVSDPYLGLQTVFWSTPTPKPVFIIATVAIYPGQVWSSVVQSIMLALAAAAVAPTPANNAPPVGQLKPGTPVIGSQLEAVIQGVSGVADARAPTVAGGAPTPLRFDFVASPVNVAPLLVDPLSVATISNDSTHIVLLPGVYP
jgi:uncharacterized phage protein gp47/JayE